MYIRLARWFSPALLHLLLVTCRQICKPLSITRVRDMCCCLSKLSLGKQLSIIRAAINQCMDQCIATLWNTFDAIACLTHRLQCCFDHPVHIRIHTEEVARDTDTSAFQRANIQTFRIVGDELAFALLCCRVIRPHAFISSSATLNAPTSYLVRTTAHNYVREPRAKPRRPANTVVQRLHPIRMH